MKDFIKKNPYQIVLGVFIVAYILYFSIFTILRHQKMYSGYYDLGIMDQTVYNTYRGRFLELTDPTGVNTIKRMAIHNDVFLALLAPFYFIHSGPETLLVLQAVIIALGAIPLYLLTKKLLHSPPLSLVFAFSYLMYPPMQRANIFDFHAVTLATTFLLFMFYLWTEKKYTASLLFFLLSIISKEQVALTTALFGIFVFFQNRRDKRNVFFALSIVVLSIVWFISSFWIIIPHFRQADHFALARYKDFGDSTGSIIKGFFTHPTVTIPRLFSFDTIYYLFLLLSPQLFISLLSPIHLFLALPDLLINLLSSEPNMKNIIHQYTAVITPFVFISAIYGTKKLLEKYKKITEKQLMIGIIAATLVMSVVKSPLPYSLEKNDLPLTQHPSLVHDVDFWKRILSNESIKIAATDSLAAQFADRKTIIRFSPLYAHADYVLLFTDQIFNDWLDWYNSPRTYTDLKNNVHFKIIYKHDTFEVYKRL